MGAAPVIPMMPLPILLATHLTLKMRQEIDEEGNIDAGGFTPVFLKLWDDVMHNAEEENKKEEGLRDLKYASKRTKQKVEENNKKEGKGDVEMGQEEQEDEPLSGLNSKEAFSIVAILDMTVGWADRRQGHGGVGEKEKKKEERIYRDSI